MQEAYLYQKTLNQVKSSFQCLKKLNKYFAKEKIGSYPNSWKLMLGMQKMFFFVSLFNCQLNL